MTSSNRSKYTPSLIMDHTHSLHRGKFRSPYFLIVIMGILWTFTSVQCLEYRRVSRKLFSSPEPELDTQFSSEDLRKLLSILEGTPKKISSTNDEASATTERASAMQHNAMILPELMRVHSSPSDMTTTTEKPAMSRVTTRRFYRRLRRKTTTTESPLAEASTTLKATSEVESSRMLPTGPSPGELFQQLSLLNGILGALDSSTAQAPTTAPSSSKTGNANDNATSVPDFLALFTGAKNKGEASSMSEVVLPPPSSSLSPSLPQVDNPTAALAILNLFSNTGSASQSKDSTDNGNNNAADNLLSLVAQSQQAAMQPSASSSSMKGSETDATAAALTKLLLQSSVPAASAMQSNSIVQPQYQHSQGAEATAPQLHNLLGLLGTLGAASQQSQSGNINQLFNLGGDQVAQAQTTNSLAQLFGQQTQQQQAQTQNLLSLLGGNQGNQGFNLGSLLAQQTGNSIPGLGLLSTMSSLGSTIFSTVSNIFGGSRQDGKPRVRGKGVDTRVGLGYRLGNIGDAQVVWDIGPQLFTDPLRNEARPYTQKRESGSPSNSHYFQSASTTATEKEVQQIEAKRRMVQAAIQDHYRGNHFASVYPKPSQRRSHNSYDYSSHSYHYPQHSSSAKSSTTDSSSSFLSSLPFADHIKGFWTGLTSGLTGSDTQETPARSHYFNFDDVRSDFSANLIKRSSPVYTEYESSRAFHPRQLQEDIDDPTHSTLTEYERMLLQYGKDIGVADTQNGVIYDEPKPSESSFLTRWFQSPSTSPKPTQQPTEWGYRSNLNDDIPARQPSRQPQKSVKKSFHQPSVIPPSPPATPSTSPYGYDGSFYRRNNHPSRRNGPRPQKRRSHNPFRNWLASFKQSGQRPRKAHPTGGFGRRHFKRPSVSANPKLQHFTNTNKDLMMADANDDFVESAGVESYNPGYEPPVAYSYANEFPDVELTVPVAPPSHRSRPASANTGAKTRASLTQRERVVEPALLYDHLQVSEPNLSSEVDASFHQRNKVVVNSALKEREKLKILGTSPPPAKSTIPTLTKIQRLRLQNKLRANSTAMPGKHKIIVKIKGDKGATLKNHPKVVSPNGNNEMSESTTALPSVLSTISSLFSGTTKPKLLNSLIRNVTALLPSISSIQFLPRKKKKEHTQTKLTLQNGKPAIVAVSNPGKEDDDQETAADGNDTGPVVQVGHDMSFAELQNIFTGKNNDTKRRRIRIRVKESAITGHKNVKDADDTDKERKDSDEDDEEEEEKDIFVDIESGEVSVLKPVASLVSFDPKKEEGSDEEEVDYYEDDDGDGIADADMNRKQHIFEAIQTELVRNFEKMKRKQLKAEEKKRRKQELVEKGMDESMDVVTKYFDLMKSDNKNEDEKFEAQQSKIKSVGGLSM